MSKDEGSANRCFRSGDRVEILVDGTWVPAEYEGFAAGDGHVVRTDRTVVVIPDDEPRLRRSGEWVIVVSRRELTMLLRVDLCGRRAPTWCPCAGRCTCRSEPPDGVAAAH